MTDKCKTYGNRVKRLKKALLEYLVANDRHYGDMTRQEQSIEDLAQALNTRLDQLSLVLENRCSETPEPETPGQRLANRFLETAVKLTQGGSVDHQVADEFERSLDLFDQASDLERRAETAVIKHKRRR